MSLQFYWMNRQKYMKISKSPSSDLTKILYGYNDLLINFLEGHSLCNYGCMQDVRSVYVVRRQHTYNTLQPCLHSIHRVISLQCIQARCTHCLHHKIIFTRWFTFFISPKSQSEIHSKVNPFHFHFDFLGNIKNHFITVKIFSTAV